MHSTPYRGRPAWGCLGFIVDSRREHFPPWHINPQISQIFADSAFVFPVPRGSCPVVNLRESGMILRHAPSVERRAAEERELRSSAGSAPPQERVCLFGRSAVGWRDLDSERARHER